MYESELASVPLFSDLSKKDLSRIGATCRQQEYSVGQPVVWQGTSAAAFFILLSGKLKLLQQRPDGDTHQIATLEPGETFGEMALVDDQPRSATAVATEPSVVLALPAWDFRALLREEPDILLAMLRALSRRVREREAGAHV